jgi:hypothetical protein
MREYLVSLILGRRLTSHPDVPEGSLPPDVTLRRGKLIPWLGGICSRMTGSAAAVTLGKTIVVSPEARLTATLLTHELAHVRQWQRDPLFIVRYSLATLRHGYRNNPYEVEARSLASADWPVHSGPERT